MKNKKLHLILTIFSLVVFCTISLQFTGCYLVQYIANPYMRAEEDDLDAEEKVAREYKEQEAKKEEKQTEVEQEALAAESAEELAEEAKKPIPGIPNEPVTYTGSIGEEGQVPIAVILKVNFKTAEVTGSLSLGGDNMNTYVDATIMDGKIDVDTLKIISNYSGVMGSKSVEGSEGVEYQINGIISGIITDDLSAFNGEMSSEEGKQKFTATRK